MKTLLSLSGGGLKSVVQTTILDRIEKEILHGSVYESVDLGVGTSGDAPHVIEAVAAEFYLVTVAFDSYDAAYAYAMQTSGPVRVMRECDK